MSKDVKFKFKAPKDTRAARIEKIQIEVSCKLIPPLPLHIVRGLLPWAVHPSFCPMRHLRTCAAGDLTRARLTSSELYVGRTQKNDSITSARGLRAATARCCPTCVQCSKWRALTVNRHFTYRRFYAKVILCIISSIISYSSPVFETSHPLPAVPSFHVAPSTAYYRSQA